jgi:hypothetical protein
MLKDKTPIQTRTILQILLLLQIIQGNKIMPNMLRLMYMIPIGVMAVGIIIGMPILGILVWVGTIGMVQTMVGAGTAGTGRIMAITVGVGTTIIMVITATIMDITQIIPTATELEVRMPIMEMETIITVIIHPAEETTLILLEEEQKLQIM